MTSFYLPFCNFISLSCGEIEFPLSLVQSTNIDHNENEHDKVYQKHESDGKVKPDTFGKLSYNVDSIHYCLPLFENHGKLVYTTCERTLFVTNSRLDRKTFISTKLHNYCQNGDDRRNAISTANFKFISSVILLTSTKKN